MFYISKKNARVNNAEAENSKPFFDPVIQPKLSINQSNDEYEQQADAVADKVMQVGSSKNNHSSFFRSVVPVQRKCAHCEEEGEHLQRKENNAAPDAEASTESYISSLSGGRSLQENEKSFFEPALGHDFGNVKLHTDAAANRSASNINALAYTHENNIVFAPGQYQPETDAGKRLLAHELTHVVQQHNGLSMVQRITCETTAAVPTVAPGTPNAIDPRAQNIITRAADATVDLQTRATRVISDIICAYYAADAGKVRNITYNATRVGLRTSSVGSGATAVGDIETGDYFVNNTNATQFARRVMQVGHELKHIEQYRSGLAGGTHQDEREFLAFYWNGTSDELEGTGRMSHNMRKDIIDQALGYYYCLDATLQQTHQTKQQELITKRATVNGTNGNAPTNPPTACHRQP